VITANLLYGTVLGENERKNEEARTELKIGDICRLSKKKDEWVLLARMKDEHIICRDNQLIRMDYFLLKHNIIMVLVGSYVNDVFLSCQGNVGRLLHTC
jgi:hypothetical protein